ncbi:MAG: hypothetical protein NT076_01570 [Candidatus Pacearchaeota archaeon]|nr:hypothetical protein [Candidatus Pacearchaeota archaeon]
MVRYTLYRIICSRLEGKLSFRLIQQPKKSRDYSSDSIIRVSATEASVVEAIREQCTRNVRGNGLDWLRVLFYHLGEHPYKERVCIEILGRSSTLE